MWRPVSPCSSQVALASVGALLAGSVVPQHYVADDRRLLQAARSASSPSPRLISKTTSTALRCCWRWVRWSAFRHAGCTCHRGARSARHLRWTASSPRTAAGSVPTRCRAMRAGDATCAPVADVRCRRTRRPRHGCRAVLPGSGGHTWQGWLLRSSRQDHHEVLLCNNRWRPSFIPEPMLKDQQQARKARTRWGHPQGPHRALSREA